MDLLRADDDVGWALAADSSGEPKPRWILFFFVGLGDVPAVLWCSGSR